MDTWEESLSSVGAQNIDTSGYQVTDLEDIKFHCGHPILNMDAVFRPGIQTLFSPTTFGSLEIGGSVGNRLYWTIRRTRRIRHTQPQSLRDPIELLRCCEVKNLERD